MANWMRHEQDLRKHEEKEKLDLRAQKLFGAVKSLNRKILRSKLETISSGHQTVEMTEDYQREFELQKCKAIIHISRLQTRLI